MAEDKKLTKEGGYYGGMPVMQVPVGLAQTVQMTPPPQGGGVPTQNGMQTWGNGGSYTWSPLGGLQQLPTPASGAPSASQTPSGSSQTTPTPGLPAGQTFNPYTYGRNTSEFNFLADAGTPGRIFTIDQILQALASGTRPNGMADGGYPRQPSGPVSGPGGPKDDMVGPIALSNKEYVLPYEMVKYFGQGDHSQGLAALESVRKKLIQ